MSVIKNKANIDNYLKQLFYLLLVLLPASFPLPLIISSILTIALVVIWLVSGGHKNIFEALKNKFVLLFISTYIISLISLLYSQNKAEGLFVLQKKLPLLIFPLILFTARLSKKQLHSMIYSFAISCSLGSIGCFLYALYCNYEINSLHSIISSLFTVDMGIQFLGISHVYLGLYVSFAIIIWAYFLFTKEKHDYISILISITLIFLLFFLILLGGKMSIISTLFLSLIACSVYIIKTRNWIRGAIFIIFPLVIFFITINYSENLKVRFNNLFNPVNYVVGDNQWNNISARLSILKCTIDTFKKNPIIGTGLGDVQDNLDECNEGLKYNTLKGMNPHNQYLQYLLGTGIIGLLAFMGSLIYPFVNAFRDKNKLYLSFIFLFSLCFLTESLLERQHGVMLFAFFNSLFAFHFSDGIKDNVVNEVGRKKIL